MICPACNHDYEETSSEVACGACLMRGSCGLVKCPHCGYETPREPGFLNRMLARVTRREIPVADGCLVEGQGGEAGATPPPPVPAAARAKPSLVSLPQGESAVVEKFAEIAHARKFLSLGILPGTTVTVLKQFPAVVLRVGYSEFAFDRQLAATVLVRPA